VGNYESPFQAGYIAVLLVIVAFIAFIMIVDKISYNRKENPTESSKEKPKERSTLNEEEQVMSRSQ
jgi:large-conductance mechanosensitive channel